MPKTKKAPAVKDPSKLSPLEAKLKETLLENESLAKANKERKKHLEEMERLQAQERMLTAGPQEEEPEPEASSFMARNIGIGGGGVVRGMPRDEQQAEEFLQKQEAFEALLGDFQDTAGKVEIYRLKDGNNWAKMGSFSAKEWGNSLESVAKKFGGGTFKVRLRAPNGTMAGETITEFDEEAYPKPSAIAQPIVVPNNNIEMMKFMAESQEKANDRFMLVMGKFMESMGNVTGQKQNMISSVQDLALFKEMFTPKNEVKKNPLEDMNTLLTVLQQGMNLGAQTAPTESEGGLLGGLLKNLMSGENLNRVGDILRQVVTPMPPPPPPAPAQPQIARQPAPVQQAQPVTKKPEEGNAMNLAVIAYKPIILGYATKKSNPKKVAEIIVSRVGAINEGWLLIVDDFLKLPTTKDEFVYKYAPELRQFDGWVDKVMKEMGLYIRELMEEAEAEVADEKTKQEAAGSTEQAPAGGEGQPEEPQTP
jgi:hypothetical protein